MTPQQFKQNRLSIKPLFRELRQEQGRLVRD